MIMNFKKEVVNSVVYENSDIKTPIRSVYVMKDWLQAQGATGPNWPSTIELTVKV